MHHSRAEFLLIPSILAIAWRIARFTSHGFVPAAILLTGGALLAGFAQAMQRLWQEGLDAGRTAIGIAIGLVFRLSIGVSAICGMVWAAMWSNGTL